MTNMSHVDSMTVIGTRLPVEDNTALYFGDGYYEGYNSCLESYRHDVSPEWYHALNDFMDYMSYCEYMATPIDIESLLDKNGKVDLSSKENIETKKEIIKEHIEKQKLFLEKVEGFNEWKFLNNPEKYPFVQEIMISGRLISKEYKISAELDSFLIGYNENTYLDSLNDNYKYGDGDEEILDKSARESITSVKYLHSRLINAIDVNTENLNKLNFTQSSIFAIPSPNVPTLPHGVGSNSQVTQTADSSIAKGIEKALGNIRDGLAETFDCSFGMSCSNDLDKAAKNPNVGKPHTGGDQIPEQGRTDTGGDQIPEHIDNTHITPLPNQITVEDIAYLSENKNNIKNKWHQGSFNSPDESLQKHYEKHGKEVGAGSVEQYRNKAEEFIKNLKGARTVKVRGATNNVTRYYKNGKYLDRTSEGKIISFGKQ
ncbi:MULTISPECIES: hypothetical protein [Providencia]|uniref:Uncharacterized protein n=2 Tax=Providencia TaxID=586 RepID=A0ABY9ZDF6_9GAMM|nr:MULTISPECIES: hypothetical protein [Providencia]WNK25474.1 hypothetical protein PZ638_06225 [Providencia hangzhouensis]